MKSQLEKRLQELKAEYEKGQQRLKELQEEATQTGNAMMRISGAIQVLEEELAKMAGKGQGEQIRTNHSNSPQT